MASTAAPPPCPSAAHVNVDVVGARVPARVDAEPADKIRVLELHDLHSQTYHTAVDCGDFPIPIGVDGHIRGVAVLVLTVPRCAPNRPVVRRSPESRVDVYLDIGHRVRSVPARDLRDHELELVQQFRIHSRVARPHARLVVIQEVTDLQVPGDLNVDVGWRDLQKPFRRRSFPSDALGQISDPLARQALERRLNDDDEGVRAKARWALSKLKKVASRTAMAK